MFSINEAGNITLSVGDTASFTVTTTGYTFGENDRALFTVKNAGGTVIFERAYALDTELGNGVFLVEFLNADTDTLTPGNYSWDVRYIINPYYDDTGRIVDGDQVITPKTALTLTLIPTVGEV